MQMVLTQNARSSRDYRLDGEDAKTRPSDNGLNLSLSAAPDELWTQGTSQRPAFPCPVRFPG